MNPVGRKRSFYFPDWMTRELEVEATRLDRSVSWILQRAWLLARAHLRKTERPTRVGAGPPTSQPG
jgi:uncharacterized small protein (TIGR04563 family)